MNAYKSKIHIYTVCKKPTSDPKIDRLKVRGWKYIFHANGKQKKARVSILISDKIDPKIKIRRHKEGHYIMVKGPIQGEGITVVNIYAPNLGAPQYIRQTPTDTRGEVDGNTVTVGGFTKHSYQWTDHQNRKLIRKHKY